MVYGSYLHHKYPSLDPDSHVGYNEVSTGYRVFTGNLGSVTSAQTAMQVAEVDSRLREGMKTVEMGVISPDVFETIPEEHFNEIRQLAKVSGAEVTMHAPLIDPTGFKEGNWLGEHARAQAERQLKHVVDMAAKASPGGNIPVTIHGAGVDVQAKEWGEVEGMKGPQMTSMTIVNQDSGQMTGVKGEWEHSLHTKKPEYHDPIRKMRAANSTSWHDMILKVQDMVKESDSFVQKAEDTHGGMVNRAILAGKIKPSQLNQEQRRNLEEYHRLIGSADIYKGEAEMKIRNAYEAALKFPNKKAKKLVSGTLGEINKIWGGNAKKMEAIERKVGRGKEWLLRGERVESENHLLKETLRTLSELPPPDLFVPVEDFARDKAAKTLSNIALDSAMKKDKTFKENAPIISIENVWPNIAFSRADELKGLIKETRKQFVKTAVKKGANEDKAREYAEKKIGATWDVGHMNTIRKYGFTEKDVVKEAEQIAKFVKHVHIHDNFGFADTHLPVGMGNAPIKEVLKTLKQNYGYDGKAILEGGGFAAQFKGASPQPYSLEGLDTPIYYSGAGPTWGGDQLGYAPHFSGYGITLPEKHFAMFGGGFSQLPVEMGGKIGRGGFSGTPME